MPNGKSYPKKVIKMFTNRNTNLAEGISQVPLKHIGKIIGYYRELNLVTESQISLLKFSKILSKYF